MASSTQWIGWSAHELRTMLNDSILHNELADVKVRCADCGAVYLVSKDHYIVGTSNCPRCYERHHA